MWGSKNVPIYVDSKDKVPKVEHYAIFKFFSVSQSLYTPNDSSVDGCKYEAYLEKGPWLAEIEHLEARTGYGRESYFACVVKPVEVKTKVEVDVSGA